MTLQTLSGNLSEDVRSNTVFAINRCPCSGSPLPSKYITSDKHFNCFWFAIIGLVFKKEIENKSTIVVIFLL
jgi:hypothetical protein